MKDDQLDLVTQKLRWLRLPGMAEQLRTLLAKAAKENLSGLDLVDHLCDEEKASRLRNAVARRIRDARFHRPARHRQDLPRARARLTAPARRTAAWSS